MKNILKGGLGATLILVLIYLVSVQVSSCRSKSAKPIRIPIDTTAGGGSKTGLLPKTVIIARCALNNCYGEVVPNSIPVPPGALAVDMVFTLKDSIPANSVIHLLVYESQDSANSSKDDKAN